MGYGLAARPTRSNLVYVSLHVCSPSRTRAVKESHDERASSCLLWEHGPGDPRRPQANLSVICQICYCYGGRAADDTHNSSSAVCILHFSLCALPSHPSPSVLPGAARCGISRDDGTSPPPSLTGTPINIHPSLV